MQPELFRTSSLIDPRVLRILAASIEAADPRGLVNDALKGFDYSRYRNIHLLGLGKAAQAMTLAAAAVLPEFADALIITKHTDRGAESGLLRDSRFTMMEAGHPVPDERSVRAGQAALRFASEVKTEDILICLISGGGSALATAPMSGITLGDLRQLTNDLLLSGASIDEINVLRRQIDLVKGGGLAATAGGAVLSLILSDVPGDQIEAIASGPTVTDHTTSLDALNILRRRGVRCPESIASVLRAGAGHRGTPLGGRVENRIIGGNRLAVLAAARQAEVEGLQPRILGESLRGEARQAGIELARGLRSEPASSGPICIVAGGETTVTVVGSGKGGRNQELALAAVDEMDLARPSMLVSVATDGEDGPTEAAGAVATTSTRNRAAQKGMRAEHYLQTNNSYAFFDALGDLIKTGPTGTNVNDLALLIRF